MILPFENAFLFRSILYNREREIEIDKSQLTLSQTGVSGTDNQYGAFATSAVAN